VTAASRVIWLFGCSQVAVFGSAPSTVTLTVGRNRSTIAMLTVAAGFGAGVAVLVSVVSSSFGGTGLAAACSAFFAARLDDRRLRAFAIGVAVAGLAFGISSSEC
jgi:hypothetical protein